LHEYYLAHTGWHETCLYNKRTYEFWGYNPIGNVNAHCHDHCQNNNECPSGKAKRGFEHPIINFKGTYYKAFEVLKQEKE
jgi:hypothetical protein